MLNKFRINNFEPQNITHAKDVLDKYLREAKRLNPKEEEGHLMQKKEPSLWQRFLNFFKR
jgi:hypothetical protein